MILDTSYFSVIFQSKTPYLRDSLGKVATPIPVCPASTVYIPS